MLFHATDDEQAASTVERMIDAAGLDAVKAGVVDADEAPRPRGRRRA
jgi:predicted dinucleotide-binding enzyme